MSSPGLEDAGAQGATWPDVGLAVVSFAREDTVGFVAAVIAVGIAFRLAFRRTRQTFRNDYLRYIVSEMRRSAQDGPPGGKDND